MEKYQIEICTNSVESCLAAQEGGANRVELCAGIPEGGTTPSYGEIAIAREVLTHTRLHVIIRPRGGDFLYSDMEIRTMLKDIEIARRLGADGVVFGCLTADGEVDLTSMQILMEASKGLSVTFHRAFDVCRNPQKALEEIIELGCNRILTSGQQPMAEQGIGLLKELQGQIKPHQVIQAKKQLGDLKHQKKQVENHEETGINEFHFSARESIQSEMKFRNEVVSMGGTVHINEYERNVTSVRRVKETVEALYKGM